MKVRAITDPGHMGKWGVGGLCTSLATRKVLQTCGLQCRGGHLAQTMLALKTKYQFVCRDSLRSAEMVGSTTDLCILVFAGKK